ncbi:MAG: DUF2179 domain-containing protein [Bacteroidales bacterium]|nr:DUF2179 domain-containing protein [Bacteroidales bacterium]
MIFFDAPVFDLLILPLFIFVARICDVTLDTMRIIFVSKGFKIIAPIIGFFEVLIWIVVITRIMHNLDNWICYVAYAGGFATGNYIGMLLDEKLAIGHELVRVITKKDANELINALRESGYGVTTVNAMGMQGEVGILYIVINRKKLKDVIETIYSYNPNAFFTVENIGYVNKTIYQYKRLTV